MSARRVVWVVGALIMVGAIVVVGRFMPSEDEGGGNDDRPTFVVQRGPLVISISEAGAVSPREQIIIKSKVEGQTSILSLVEEGKEVAEGELLIELDASKLQDELVNQQIQVINAEATFVGAREGLEVVKSQAQADADKAQLDFEFAGQDLAQYEKGEYPKLLKEAMARITLAEQTVSNAEGSLEWSRKLFEEDYLAASELERDELAAQKAKLDLELSQGDLKLLEEYTYSRQMKKLESDLQQARMAVERVQRKGTADIAEAGAKLKAREAEHRRQIDKLAKIEQQLKYTKIIAPRAGTVIYASSTKTSWRGNDEPLSEGQSVRERQELIHLPTTASFDAEIKVHEASLKKIRVGLPVRITVEALPGKSFTGRIASIAPLPNAQSAWMNPDLKVYNTNIEIDGDGEGLKNGMSCLAETVVARYEDAVYVPIQAVTRVEGRTTVYLGNGKEPERREVKIGLDNNRMVHILAGLEGGETVLLAPPLASGAAQQPAIEGDLPAEEPEVEKKPAPARGEDGGRERRGGGAADGGAKGDGGGAKGGGAEGGGRDASGGRQGDSAEREKMRERFKNMTPEEREAYRNRSKGNRGGGQ